MLGNILVVDKIIYAYHGEDASILKIDTNIPSKPHEYGLSSHLGCQRTLWSQLPLVVDIEPKTPSNKVEPHVAVLRIADRISKKIHDLLHTITYSGFAARSSMEHIPGFLTMSISSSRSSGYLRIFHPIYQLVTHEQYLRKRLLFKSLPRMSMLQEWSAMPLKSTNKLHLGKRLPFFLIRLQFTFSSMNPFHRSRKPSEFLMR